MNRAKKIETLIESWSESQDIDSLMDFYQDRCEKELAEVTDERLDELLREEGIDEEGNITFEVA